MSSDVSRMSIVFTSFCVVRAFWTLGIHRMHRSQMKQRERDLKFSRMFITIANLNKRVIAIENKLNTRASQENQETQTEFDFDFVELINSEFDNGIIVF